jgi:hypothetical protein
MNSDVRIEFLRFGTATILFKRPVIVKQVVVEYFHGLVRVDLTVRLGQTVIELVEPSQGIAHGFSFMDAPVGVHVAVHNRHGVAVGDTSTGPGAHPSHSRYQFSTALRIGCPG